MSVAPRIQSKCFLQKRTRYRSQLRIRQSTCSAEIAPTPPVRSNLCTSLTAVPSKITKTMSGKATVEEQFSSKIIHPAMRVQHSHSSSACALPQDQLFIVCFVTRPTALRQLFGVCFVTRPTALPTALRRVFCHKTHSTPDGSSACALPQDQLFIVCPQHSDSSSACVLSQPSALSSTTLS